MRFFLWLSFLVALAFSAQINEKLYSEENASKEIGKIRTLISHKVSASPQEQNKISIQKLFLDKIETLASTPYIETLKSTTVPKDISQKEFLKYFDTLAIDLDKMLKHIESEKKLHKRLYSIQEDLEAYIPGEKNKILQAQLEYAYFKWKEIFNTKKIAEYKQYLESEKPAFRESFANTKVDIKKLEKQTEKQNIQLQTLYQKKVYLELRLEKETILLASKEKVDLDDGVKGGGLLSEVAKKPESWKYSFVLDELDKINMSISNMIKAKNDTLLLRQVKNLQDEDLESYIIVREIMQSLSADLSPEDKHMFTIQSKMLEWLKYEHIDSFTTILYDFNAWMNKFYEKISILINTPLFYQNNKPVVIFDFLKMFFTIFIGFMIAKFYKLRVIAAQKRINFIHKQSFKIVGNIGYYIIVIIAFAISLSNIGLDLSSLSLVAGALSVGIGFGLKEVVGNFVSGIILMVERSVKIGDFVEIDNTVSGNITDIRMRSVTIKTSSNIDVVVPNSLLVQQTFTNYTLEEPVRRLSIPFTVAYGISFETVNKAILDALEASDLKHIRHSNEYLPEIIMSGMDERGINHTLFVFVSTYGANARSSFFRLVYKALLDNKLPIPSARLDVNVKNS